MFRLAVKRFLDIVVAVVGLLVASPLLAIIAVLVRVTSPGPILFRQTRLGKHEKQFQINKFRTMTVGAAYVRDGLAVSRGDARITPVGRFLRKSSLDELPQLFNVLTGDLSLVGPRPSLPEQLPYYTAEHRKRFRMRPGLTGLATISGRASIPWSQRLRYDVEYVERFTLTLDLRILLKTVAVVALGKDTYYDPINGPAFDLADPDSLPQARLHDVEETS